MRTKKVLKRIAFWLVLAVIGAGVYFVFLHGASRQDLRNLESRARFALQNAESQTVGALQGENKPSASAAEQAAACRQNLSRIESAKRALASRGMFATGDVSLDAVAREMGGSLPRCPSGGQYHLGSLEQLPTCSIGGNKSPDNADD